MNDIKILHGDCLEVLRGMSAESVHACITSPPYYNQRDYGVQAQIGLEKTPDQYIAHLVEVFAELRRVLRDDGVLFLNLGDSYYGSGQGYGDTKTTNKGHTGSRERKKPEWDSAVLKPKNLIGIPWAVAFALRNDGWYLRQHLPWVKRNPMPESVKDRPTSSVETWFMFSKSGKYYYDYEAVRRRMADSTLNDKRTQDDTYETQRVQRGYPCQASHGGGMLKNKSDKQRGHSRRHQGFNERWDGMTKDEQGRTRAFRNCDLFYESLLPPYGAISNEEGDLIALDCSTQPFLGAHFATFPPRLIEPLIKVSCPAGGTVLDPFFGAGTVGLVASRLGRNCIGIELNPEYVGIAKSRIKSDCPLFFNQVV